MNLENTDGSREFLIFKSGRRVYGNDPDLGPGAMEPVGGSRGEEEEEGFDPTGRAKKLLAELDGERSVSFCESGAE